MTGFTPPLTVTWYTMGTSGTTITHSSVTGLFDALTMYSGGPVYVSVTDGTNTASNNYGGHPPFTFTTSSTSEVCPTPGTLSASVFGGTAPYSYSWYNAATAAVVGSGSPANLNHGSYGVVITDAAGCVYGTKYTNDTSSLGLVDYGAPYTITLNATPANCTDGSVSITISAGAIPPVTYVWTNGATTSSITGLSTGTYGVRITDAVGCVPARVDSIFTTPLDTAYIFVPQLVVVNALVTPTPATCASVDGAVIAFGFGGVPPYTYLWSNGATTQSQTGLPGGSYSVRITDVNNCIGNSGTYVSISTPITVTYSTTASLCTSPTGTATINPSGGTAPYSILWLTTPPQTGLTASTLSPGNYSFNVTDAAGCTQTGQVNVPPVNIISVDFTSTPALCTLSTGSMTVAATGGVTPYTYLWSTGTTTSVLSGVPSGIYTITVTDGMGCRVTKYPYLYDYSPMTVGVTNTPASCIFSNDGALGAVAIGGTAPYSYGWSTGGTTSTISALATGRYYVHVTDATGCTENDHTYLPYDASATDCYCTISGTIFNDTNGNCVQDPGEMGINNIQVYCSGKGYTYTNSSGNYSFLVPSGTYTVSETVLAFYPLAPCESNAKVVTAVAASGCVLSANFANTMDTVHDLHITIWDYSFPVIGNSYTQVTTISNDGTVDEDSVFTSYKTDGQLFAPFIVPTGIFSGAPYYYNTGTSFPAMVAGNTSVFYMNYNVPVSIPLGTNVVFKDTVVYKAPVDNWLTDYSPWNNVNYFSTVVVASYDPNFKEVSPRGTGPSGLITYADSTLEYMVHFQNTGTSPAQNIVVIDTLDDNLDWTSMRPEYMSAACQVTMTESAGKKIAKFTFSNIFLPAKATDDLRSNGLFTYTIKTKPGLPLGTQFRNRASIYFDYNEPVMTNQTLNTLGASSGPALVNATIEKSNSLAIYPNPANRSFNAVINANTAAAAEMNIADVTGKIMIRKTINLQKGAQTVATDISQLSSGVYFITLNNSGKAETQKLVIIK